jgi:hypothetical protein
MHVHKPGVGRTTSYKRSSQHAEYSVNIVIFVEFSEANGPWAYLIKVHSMNT